MFSFDWACYQIGVFKVQSWRGKDYTCLHDIHPGCLYPYFQESLNKPLKNWFLFELILSIYLRRLIVKFTKHSQLLNIIISKLNSPVLLYLLGNIFPYCPAVRAIQKINSSNIDLQEGQCWSCNWECLYCDSSRNTRWNIAWALGKSLGLCPRDFPQAQAIFHRKSLLLSQYRFSMNNTWFEDYWYEPTPNKALFVIKSSGAKK